MKTYTIQARKQVDGKWAFQARFREGENSRYQGIKMCDSVAVAEAETFKAINAKRYRHVRLVIDL